MSFTTGELSGYICGELLGDPDIVCSGAEIDSRNCCEGKVFFAMQGENVDGHDYLDSAILSGCSAVVVEKLRDVSVPLIVVQDTRKALQILAEERRKSIRLECVSAITGSVGKTTTKDILAHILGEGTTSSRKSFNNDLGVPLTILDAEDSNYLVAEVGANDVGEIEPLADLIQPDVAILTSIERAHLDGFGNLNTVLVEKGKLLQAVPKRGFVVVPDTIDVSGIDISATVCTVGSKSSDVYIKTGTNPEGFSTLEIEGHKVVLSLLGSHNAVNAALAIVAARHILKTISIQKLLALAAEVSSPDGRLNKQRVKEIVFYDDSYNANPASMRSAIEFFSAVKGRRKVLVLGAMLELGEHSHFEHKLLANLISKTEVDLIILVGQEMEPVSEMLGSIFEPVSDDSAIERIANLLCPRDTVLIKGSRGFKLERII
jgi:UDP-N-acetylmuramoyl-tripeptide--D-alanyl-D-alanine ligase